MHPDDCLTDYLPNSPSDEWYPEVSGHAGYVMFGTPEMVLYGGCEAGPNFGNTDISMSETLVPFTNILRFVVAESNNAEDVLINISNLEVLTAGDIEEPTTTTEEVQGKEY